MITKDGALASKLGALTPKLGALASMHYKTNQISRKLSVVVPFLAPWCYYLIIARLEDKKQGTLAPFLGALVPNMQKGPKIKVLG